MKAIIAMAILALLPQMASADVVSDLFKSQKYSCFIIGILDKQDDTGFEFDFEMEINDKTRGSHGGQERTFKFKNHEVVAVANDKWLGLAWWKSGRKIGESVTLSTATNAQSRVVLLMNPKNEYERVSITCDLIEE